jgi:hypothetical protein
VHAPRIVHPSAVTGTGAAPSTMNPAVLQALSHPDFDAHADYQDDPNLFVWSTQSGIVPADTLLSASAPAHRQPQLLTVSFRPIKAGRFLSEFLLVVYNGANGSDRGIPIRLRAEASHREDLDRYHE